MDHDKVSLTGIGLVYGTGACIAPLDFNKAYKGQGSEDPSTIRTSPFVPPDTALLCTFVFHAACWELLNKLYGQIEVPLSRLYIVLRP